MEQAPDARFNPNNPTPLDAPRKCANCGHWHPPLVPCGTPGGFANPADASQALIDLLNEFNLALGRLAVLEREKADLEIRVKVLEGDDPTHSYTAVSDIAIKAVERGKALKQHE